ncbi:hypothetical protein GCK72_006989 [Caenorhabditis remanei]|uniref:F-box associated domain-containing protein n=1 Tax=Caenorhabditis remanei TaxID=31234 RepID=A0A6A5HIS5_CAERE|nr:hypothetical protein GCK72_006989 [Caenorhabditis remanei]KAF1767031.1 hypothetical protein GCK72_006989 [Caenorhabditis remanei]
MSQPYPDYELIKALNENLVPYNLRREGIIPPYSVYVQLQISFGDSIKHVERLEYKQYVYNAMKYLIWKFFTGRKTILTQNFGFYCEDVVRLPQEMKIHTKNLHLKTSKTNTIRKLKPFLVPECFPLDSFKTNGRNIEVNNDIIRTSKLLLITDNRDLNLRQIEHSNIRLLDMMADRSEFIALLRHWLENIPSVGTSFSLRMAFRYLAEDVFKELERNPVVTIRKIARRRRLHFPLQALIPLLIYKNILLPTTSDSVFAHIKKTYTNSYLSKFD